jgi:hypothetical protein
LTESAFFIDHVCTLVEFNTATSKSRDEQANTHEPDASLAGSARLLVQQRSTSMSDTLTEKLPFGISDLPYEPLEDSVNSYSPFELAAMRTRLAARGIDVADRTDGVSRELPPSWLASTALGLVPGAGFADVLGLLPDLEKGGHHPNLVRNLLNRDFGTAGWQLLGALGDTTYLGGPVLGASTGTVLKSGRAAQLAGRGAHVLEHAPRRDGVPQVDIVRYNPRRGVRERTARLVQNQEVRDALLKKIEEGRAAGEEWYNTEPLRQAFIKRLGSDEGQVLYDKFLGFVAAASPMSPVGESIRNATHYFNRWRRGEGVATDPPPGYGHRYQALHQRLMREVEGEGFDPIRHAKVLSFLENLRGNYHPVTVDMHAFRLPVQFGKDPAFLKKAVRERVSKKELSIDEAFEDPRHLLPMGRNEYAAIEQLYRDVAVKLGLEPAQAQAAAWVAGARETGSKSTQARTFMEFFEKRLEKTANEKGLTPEEVLDQLIEGRMDLTSLDEPVNSFA